MPALNPWLPGHNCGACGFRRCDQYADALDAGRAELADCLPLRQDRYKERRARIQGILGRGEHAATPAPPVESTADAPEPEPRAPVGLLDRYQADFVLAPLAHEAACREILLPITPKEATAGDVIRYRPLGCPIVHFARILASRDGLFTVHVVGPRHRIGEEDFTFIDVGLCMVIGFEGRVRGRPPEVGETVRFLPAACMMQKVHSGVVVQSEGGAVRIEGLDLKVWAPPIRA